jgi:protoporphyrinogen/coproporphyrinogen III oxidase
MSPATRAEGAGQGMVSERGIGVIGAGPSGLAAAWWLTSRGHQVQVYEGREVGGRLRTERLGGSGADVVVQLLSEAYTQVLELAGGVGAGGLLVQVPGRDALWRGGRAHPLRYGSVASMASSGALPARLKLKLGVRYLPFLERHSEVLDLNDPSRATAAGLDGETIAEWGRRELGEDFVELMAYPLLAAYYGVTPEETGAGVFHALARAGTRVKLLGIRGGVGALGDAVARWLRERGTAIREGSRVEAMEAGPDGVRLRLAGGEVEHDGVVLAVPAREAARLVPSAEWLSTIRSRSTATLVLATDRPVRPGWFGLSLPRSESLGRDVAAVCVQEEKETAVNGDGSLGALVVVPTPESGEWWSGADPGRVVESAMPTVEMVLPGIRERIVEARLVRLPEATFVPAPGHFDQVKRLESLPLPQGVALAGDYLIAPTVEGAVRSGLRAARRVTGAAG